MTRCDLKILQKKKKKESFSSVQKCVIIYQQCNESSFYPWQAIQFEEKCRQSHLTQHYILPVTMRVIEDIDWQGS